MVPSAGLGFHPVRVRRLNETYVRRDRIPPLREAGARVPAVEEPSGVRAWSPETRTSGGRGGLGTVKQRSLPRHSQVPASMGLKRREGALAGVRVWSG